MKKDKAPENLDSKTFGYTSEDFWKDSELIARAASKKPGTYVGISWYVDDTQECKIFRDMETCDAWLGEQVRLHLQGKTKKPVKEVTITKTIFSFLV